MPRGLSQATITFLECLAEAMADTAASLARPTVGSFTAGARDDEPLERKLRRLADRGVITLPEPTDLRIVRLTELGRTLAAGGVDPAARWARPWDGRWRMVLFDVAEANRPERNRLRHTLHRARLGYLQGSVWISPDPLDPLRDAIRAMTANPEALLFFEGRPSAGESDAALVDGAWDFPRLAEAHRECLDLLQHAPADSDPPQRWRRWLRQEREAWLRALDLDPLLPESLLPRHYLGKKVHTLRRTLLRRALPHCGIHAAAPTR